MINRLLKYDEKISGYFLIPEEKIFAHKFAAFFAHSGDSWFLEIGLFFIWIFSKGLIHTYSALFAGAIIIQAVIVLAIKFLIKRRRPEGDWGAVYRNSDPHSFPSGHSARMMMLSMLAFGLELPFLGWGVLIWGIGVSFARVGLGVHFLVDILAGWLIGICLAEGILALQPFFYKYFAFAF